jgi:hypothetical protein
MVMAWDWYGDVSPGTHLVVYFGWEYSGGVPAFYEGDLRTMRLDKFLDEEIREWSPIG